MLLVKIGTSKLWVCDQLPNDLTDVQCTCNVYATGLEKNTAIPGLKPGTLGLPF